MVLLFTTLSCGYTCYHQRLFTPQELLTKSKLQCFVPHHLRPDEFHFFSEHSVQISDDYPAESTLFLDLLFGCIYKPNKPQYSFEYEAFHRDSKGALRYVFILQPKVLSCILLLIMSVSLAPRIIPLLPFPVSVVLGSILSGLLLAHD